MAAKVPAAGVDLDGAVTVNESSADVDFRIETNGNANMFLVDGGNDAVIFNGSTSNFASSSQAIQIYNSGLAFTSGYGIQGGVNADRASINLTSGASGHTVFKGNNSETARILNYGNIATGGETAPDVDAGGLCLNQGAADGPILTFKSSDIAHGQTGGDETDTYAKFSKNHATVGGLRCNAYSEGESAYIIDGRYSTDNTTKGTGASCPVQVNVRKIDGTSVTSPGANANMFSVTNNGQTKFIVDEDGDLHYDGSASAYDSYEDAHLVRALDLSHGVGVINSKFDKFVSYNHEKLADMKLVGREENGTPNHFINVTGMQRLHNGAIWQQYEKHQKLAEAVYEMAKEALGEDKADAILEKHDIKLLK